MLELDSSGSMSYEAEGVLPELFGAQLELDYDATLVLIDSITAGLLLQGNGSVDQAGGFFQYADIDNSAGRAVFVASLLAPAAPASGPGELAVVTLTCIAEGTATVALTKTLLADGNAQQVASQGFDATVACGSAALPVDVPLVTGFNLIGIPVQFTSTTRAKDLAQQVADQGGEVSSVLAWNAGSQVFDPWAAANPDVNNFELQAGQGYFVRVVTPPTSGSWSATGLPITAGVPLDFAVGFNLVSFPFTSQAYTAKTLAEAIDVASDNPSSILGWTAPSQVFDPWAAANPDVNPFDIASRIGYFVRMTAAVTGFAP